MGSADLARALNFALAMVLSLCFHEAAHAWMASLRGDDTAKDAGRLTLNPLAHIDWLGTLLLPVLGVLTQMPVIGWAKPVPVSLSQLHRPKLDPVLVALAGPFANIIIALVSIGMVFLHSRYGGEVLPKASFFYPLVELCGAMVWVNLGLALFNMLPIPPLDGSSLVIALLPQRLARQYEELIAPYGAMLLLAIIISGGLNWMPRVQQAIVQGVLGIMQLLVA